MSKFNIATEYFRSMYRAFEKDINSGKNDGNGVGLLMDAAPTCARLSQARSSF